MLAPMQLLAVLPALVAIALEPEASDLETEVQAVFEAACTACHDETDDEVNLEGDLDDLLGAPSSGDMPMVDPSNPDNSYLFVKLTGGPRLQGDLMPLEEEPLPDEQIELVREWISAMPPDAGPPREYDPLDEDPVEPEAPRKRTRSAFAGTHQIAMHTTTTLGQRVYEFRVHHRFGRAGNKRSYGGIRDGAIISLGSGYGVTDDVDLLLRFSTARLNWELGGKYVPIRQEAGKPVSFGMFASLEVITEEPERAANRFTGNLQAMVSHMFTDRVASQAMLGYSLLTNHSPNPRIDFGDGLEDVEDRRGTLDFGLAATVYLGEKRRHGIDFEYLIPIPAGGKEPDRFYFHGGDANPNGTKMGSWSLGWSARTGLHLFQVFLTNNRNIHTNFVAPGGDLALSGWGEFFLGFNLSRKWKW